MNVELSDEQKVKIRTDRDLYPIMREILLQANKTDRGKEHLWVCGLAANNLLMYIELVSLGTMFRSITDPMSVFSWALQKQTPMIIIVHNHPTEKLAASETDEDLTDRMIQVGNIVGVKVVDHMIITDKEYYSFERHGLMAELSGSKKFVPGFVQVEQLKKEAQRIGEEIGKKKGLIEGREAGAKDKAVEIAKQLKREGVVLDIIMKSTGLSRKEAEELFLRDD